MEVSTMQELTGNFNDYQDYIDSVECYFDHHDWQLAVTHDSIISYSTYLKKYPEGLFVAEAERERNRIRADTTAWERALGIDDIEAYKYYLASNSIYTEKATRRIDWLEQDEQAWHSAKADNSEESYQQYLLSYPKGKFIKAAKSGKKVLVSDRHSYEDAITINTVFAINAYLENPNGRFRNEALARLKTLKKAEEEKREKIEKMKKEEEELYTVVGVFLIVCLIVLGWVVYNYFELVVLIALASGAIFYALRK